MAMDHFMEEVVVKRNKSFNRFLYMLSWVILIVAAIAAIWGFNILTMSISNGFSWPTLLFTLVSAGIAVYTFFFHDKLLTEYEYTFTNGALDFAEVYNNKKRKSLGSLNVRNVEAFGKVSSEHFKRYLNMPDIKRMNWFLNRDAELYYFFFSKDMQKKMIIFEPSEELVGYIRQYLSRGIYQE